MLAAFKNMVDINNVGIPSFAPNLFSVSTDMLETAAPLLEFAKEQRSATRFLWPEGV
jgi:hypothetical protein